MKKILLLFILISTCLSVDAQKETYNWAFGDFCGLTWNTRQTLAGKGVNGTPDSPGLKDIPTFFETGMATIEGCFTLSDSNGQLLFYSDGVNVYDRKPENLKENYMQGGIMTGNANSAQSGIIMPYPGKPNLYMAISIGAFAANNISYATVDMSLNDGYGNIVPTVDGGVTRVSTKFQNAMGITGESCSSLKHKNNKDYWVVAPGRSGSDGHAGTPTYTDTYFNAWLVTSDNISTQPVVSISPVNIPGGSASGYFKFTPDGKHFVYATAAENLVIIGDFDDETGIFSNIKTINVNVATSNAINTPYGVEFSLKSKYLYIGCANSYILGYSLDEVFSVTDPTTIQPQIIDLGLNRYNVAPQPLQLAEDGRIYIAPQGRSYLYIIDNPDEFDALKVYRLDGLLKSRTAESGLPNFSSSWFSSKKDERPFTCTGNDFLYKIEIEMVGPETTYPTTLVWDFGDGSPTIVQDIIPGQTSYSLTHNFETKGSKTINITPVRADGTTLEVIKYAANIVDCEFRTNPMIRIDFQNEQIKATFSN